MEPADFQQTIARARGGDSDALEALCQAFYPAVERMAHRALSAQAGFDGRRLAALFSTGDVVQDVFRSVLMNVTGFEGETEGEFVNYLVVAVRTRLLDMIRFHHAVRRDRRRVDGALDNDCRSTSRDRPDRILDAEEQVAVFCEVVDSMPSRQRALVMRRIAGEATFHQLAEELGFPSADAARKAYSKAHAYVLLLLTRRGVSHESEATRP